MPSLIEEGLRYLRREALHWLSHHVDHPQTIRSKGAFLYSARLTLKMVIISSLISVIGHIFIDGIGFLPYPLVQAITIGLVLTIAITAIVGITFSYIVSESVLIVSEQKDKFERLSNYDELSGLRNRRSSLNITKISVDWVILC